MHKCFLNEFGDLLARFMQLIAGSQKWIAITLVAFALSACSNIEDRQLLAQQIAANAGLSFHTYPSQPPSQLFALASYQRLSNHQAIRIYIEGDGFAWVNRSTISGNPTPQNPVALKLAASDPSANVICLARPCQYVALKGSACSPDFWTNKRFAPEVIDSYMHMLDGLNVSSIHLVGFSGGGAIATILAAKRSDIASLTTIAGNLDTDAFTTYHQVSALKGSINPADLAAHTGDLIQTHYIGAEDTVVPKLIYQSYAKELSANHRSNSIIVPNANHATGWEALWQKVVRPLPNKK